MRRCFSLQKQLAFLPNRERSDLRVRYQQDAKMAAGFANTLLDTFRLRTMELYSRSGADELLPVNKEI